MKAFIERVAAVAVADWQNRRIMLPSVVIAQAILESGWGKSELATEANALFGIKKNGWTGKTYVKAATEQRPDGTYYTVNKTEWRAYDSWEQSVTDHNDYIATREKSKGVLRYAAILGNTNVQEVCNLLKECGYATSLTYPQKLLNLIENHNLTQYDETKRESVNMLKIAIDAGHWINEAGKRCLKSIDPNETREWVLNSRIADKLGVLLQGHNCEILRVDDTTGRKNYGTYERAAKANAWGADVYISIHHDAGLNGRKGGGTTVFYYSNSPERLAQAQALYNAVVGQTGLRGNRSRTTIKYGYDVLARTNMPAFLIENGFMDGVDDTPIILTEAHATKTAQGLYNFLVGTFGVKKVGETKPAEKPAEKPVEKPKHDSKAWVKSLQKHIKVTVDGIAGQQTLGACPLLKNGSKGTAVKLLQKRLSEYFNIEVSGGVDGIFGNGTMAAVKEFQKSKGLVVDGIVGKNTWRKLLCL